jgi:hypothetical protein
MLVALFSNFLYIHCRLNKLILSLIVAKLLVVYGMENPQIVLDEVEAIACLTKPQWTFLKDKRIDYFTDPQDLKSYESYLIRFKEYLETNVSQFELFKDLISKNPFTSKNFFAEKNDGSHEIVGFCQVSAAQEFFKVGELNVDLYMLPENKELYFGDITSALTKNFSSYFYKEVPFIKEFNDNDNSFTVHDKSINSIKITLANEVKPFFKDYNKIDEGVNDLENLAIKEVLSGDLAIKENIIKQIVELLELQEKGGSSWEHFTIFPCIVSFLDKTAYAFGFKNLESSVWEKKEGYCENKAFIAPITMQFDCTTSEIPEKFYFYPFTNKGVSKLHPLHVFIHERFHQYQHEFFTRKILHSFDSYSHDYVKEENIRFILHGTYFLNQYLLNQSTHWLGLYLNSLECRFKILEHHFLENEEYFMITEGLAEFATVKLLRLAKMVDPAYYLKTKNLEMMVKNPINYISDLPSERYYLEGYALAACLDDWDKTGTWQTTIEKYYNLLSLFIKAANEKDIKSTPYKEETIEGLSKITEEFLTFFAKADKEKEQTFVELSKQIYGEKQNIFVLRDVKSEAVSAGGPTLLINKQLKISQYKDFKQTGQGYALALQNKPIIEKTNFLTMQHKNSALRCASDIIFSAKNVSLFLLGEEDATSDATSIVENLPNAVDIGIKIGNDSWDMRSLSAKKLYSIKLIADEGAINLSSQKQPFIAYQEVTIDERYKQLVLHFLPTIN